MPFVGVTLNNTPSQLIAVIAVIDDVGFTVTVTVNVAPTQLPVVGVTIYVAVCCAFVGLINVPVILDAPLPVPPPVIPPVTPGALHAYVVPDGIMPFVPFVGVTVKLTPPQVVAVIALISALGFTVTVTVNVAPVQLPVIGVTIYVPVFTLVDSLFKSPVILEALVPDAPPVIPPVTLGALQLYKVPAGTIPFVPFTGVTLKNTPSQLTIVIAVIDDVGFTVTVTVNVAFDPHKVDVGVIVYVAVC